MKWKTCAKIACVCVVALVAVVLATDPLFARYFFDRHTAYLLLLTTFALYVGCVARRRQYRTTRRSRASRVLTWVVTTAGVALIIATLVSHQWQVQWTNSTSTRFLHLGGGNVTFFWWSTPAPTSPVLPAIDPPGWTIQPNEYRMRLWPSFARYAVGPTGGPSFIEVPLWLPLLLCALTTILLMRLDRRRFRPGHCQTCGYDLTGNVSGVCPECGEAVGAGEETIDTGKEAIGTGGKAIDTSGQ